MESVESMNIKSEFSLCAWRQNGRKERSVAIEGLCAGQNVYAETAQSWPCHLLPPPLYTTCNGTYTSLTVALNATPDDLAIKREPVVARRNSIVEHFFVEETADLNM